MTRELLLAQSSDWAFIITNKTAAHYAEMRFRGHVDNFLRLEALLAGAAPDDPELRERVTSDDCLFPGIDYRAIARGPIIRPKMRLGTPAPATRGR